MVICGQNICYHVAIFHDSNKFYMQHDHVLKKLNFDLLTLGSGEGVCGQNICHHYFSTLRDSNKFDMRDWRRETGESPPVKYFTDRSKAVFLCFFTVLCLLCLCARLFICALWSPAWKGLTSLLSFVMYNLICNMTILRKS